MTRRVAALAVPGQIACWLDLIAAILAGRSNKEGIMVSITGARSGWASGMADGELGSFDTRYERLTDHYRDLIERGQLKPGDRFPSARELTELHGVGRTTSGRVHGTLISLGLIEHRPGVGTFVLEPSAKKADGEADALVVAARRVVEAFDGWQGRSKPRALADAVEELRAALG
jgi:DNA-binding transcriptional regulator YhcF (GntR family)